MIICWPCDVIHTFPLYCGLGIMGEGKLYLNVYLLFHYFAIESWDNFRIKLMNENWKPSLNWLNCLYLYFIQYFLFLPNLPSPPSSSSAPLKSTRVGALYFWFIPSSLFFVCVPFVVEEEEGLIWGVCEQLCVCFFFSCVAR